MTTHTAPAHSAADFPAPTVHHKPWGNEVVFASGEHGYVGKFLTVLRGESLSLQYHRRKDETLTVLSGHILLEHGADAEALARVELGPRDAFHLAPGVVHRMTAVDDALLVEVSTAGEGWRDDVVRLDDRYGRAGTSA